MEQLMEEMIFSLKNLCYPLMRRMAIGMTSTYLPPVVPRKTITKTPASPKPISFGPRNSRRFAWNRQVVRGAH